MTATGIVMGTGIIFRPSKAAAKPSTRSDLY